MPTREQRSALPDRHAILQLSQHRVPFSACLPFHNA